MPTGFFGLNCVTNINLKMNIILEHIDKVCGDNGCTTMKETATELKLPYSTVHYWVMKYYKLGNLGVIFPGLGMGRNTERYIYFKKY